MKRLRKDLQIPEGRLTLSPVVLMLGEGPALYVMRQIIPYWERVLECPDGKVIWVRDIA